MKYLPFLLLSLLFKCAWAQDSYGYYDGEKIEIAHPLYQKLMEFEAASDQDLKQQQLKLERDCQMAFSALANIETMDSSQKFLCQGDLSIAIDRLKNFNSGSNDYRKMTMAYSEEMRTELRNKIQVIINLYCKEFNVQMIAEKKHVLYCPNCLDYTDDIIKYINRRLAE